MAKYNGQFHFPNMPKFKPFRAVTSGLRQDHRAELTPGYKLQVPAVNIQPVQRDALVSQMKG